MADRANACVHVACLMPSVVALLLVFGTILWFYTWMRHAEKDAVAPALVLHTYT